MRRPATRPRQPSKELPRGATSRRPIWRKRLSFLRRLKLRGPTLSRAFKSSAAISNSAAASESSGRRPAEIQILPGGNLQPVPGGAIQVFRIQANANNGNRTSTSTKRQESPYPARQNGIEVRVTEKVNGQDKTDTFKAKNAAELKQKSPEANKLYEKYGQNGTGAIQIQAQAIGVPNFGPAIPAIPLIPLVPNAAQLGQAGESATRTNDEARKLIAEATDGLKKNAPQGNESLQKAIDKLDEATRKLDDAHQKLGR